MDTEHVEVQIARAVYVLDVRESSIWTQCQQRGRNFAHVHRQILHDLSYIQLTDNTEKRTNFIFLQCIP